VLTVVFALACSLQEDGVAAAIAKFKSDMAKAKGPAEQCAAFYDLGRTQDEKTLAILTPYVTGPEGLRKPAIHAISGFYDYQKKVVPLLLKSLQTNQTDSIAVSAALEGLGKIGDENVLPTIHKYFPDKNLFVAKAAIAAAARIRHVSSIEPLLQALKAQEKALANAGSGSVGGSGIPGLNGGAIKPDASIRSSAEKLQTEANASLNKITRQVFKTSADWQKWWDANKATFQVEK
jgi:hypothetical protein